MKSIDSRFKVWVNDKLVFVLFHDYCDYDGAIKIIQSLGFVSFILTENFNYGRR